MLVDTPSHRKISASPLLARLSLAGSVVLIALVTLTPRPSADAHHAVRIFSGWSRAHLREDFLNALLFAPLGASTAALRFTRWRAFALVAGLSILIEVLQRLFVPGRFAELQDVVCNTSGAIVAFGVVWVARAVSPGNVSRN